MSELGLFQQAVRSLLRGQILDAAAELTISGGWSQVRMGDIAVKVGVSRQTVYNEVGSKPALGNALIQREAEAFLAGVAEQLDANANSLRLAFTAAARFCLQRASQMPLLAAVVSQTEGGGSGLLPLLTTRSDPIADASTAVILDRVARYWPDLDLEAAQLHFAVDALVRLVLSHIVSPTDEGAEVASQLGWLIERVVTGTSTGTST
jgi:AcrR family transcriptional regulator